MHPGGWATINSINLNMQLTQQLEVANRKKKQIASERVMFD